MELNTVLGTLQKQITFKKTTTPGDIILIGMPEGISYGLVHSIENDAKKNWYNLTFTLLTVPPLNVTWTLRIPQMCGEIFTINDQEHFVIAVDINSMKEEKKVKKSQKRSLTLIKNE